MKLGKFQIDIISDGRFKLDGGAMFGIVPKVIWNGLTPADEKNRISLALDSLLVRFDDKIFVLEAGMGSKFSEKETEIYALERNGGMLKALGNQGVDPSEVTDVLVSHLHFDHAGSLTFKDAEGKIVPTFPNAKHHIQKKHFDWAMKSSRKDSASFKKENFEPLLEKDLLEYHDGEYVIDKNFEVFTSNGHTLFQQHAKIIGPDKSLIFCGDLIPTSNHLGLPYNMGYDNYPLDNLEEKDKLLSRAGDGKTLLYFYHDPGVKMITVKKGPKGFIKDKIVPFE